jgi:hypothetical protein
MLKDVHNQRYMVAPSLLRSLHEDSQDLIDISNGPNSNNCGGHTSYTTVLKSRRGILQDVQRRGKGDRLILNKRFQICNKLLQFSLTVSLAITKGAGGCAISPVITYRYFRDFGKLYWTSSLEGREILQWLELVYRSGKARPTDVNLDGETMLDVCTPGTAAKIALTKAKRSG